jgi:hypothetical protein
MLAFQRTPSATCCASKPWKTKDTSHLELIAETHWPRGRRLVGKLVERAMLSPREADKELTNLKTIIEREAAD